jgi:hypothetical protein
MKKRRLCMLGMSLFLLWVPTVTHAQLIRLSAEFRRWDGTEDFTNVSPSSGGKIVYQKVVIVPPGKNVLFVTYATTADTHSSPSSSNRQEHICLVDAKNCNPGHTDSASSTGWIVTQRPCDNGGCGSNPSFGDRHDNSIMYQWCANITPKTTATAHTVQVRLGSTNGTNDVFNEGTHVFIDTTFLSGGCTKSTTPP